MDSNQMHAYDQAIEILTGMKNVISSARRWLLLNVPGIESYTLPAYESYSVGLFRLIYSGRQDQIADWYQYNVDPPLPDFEGGEGLDPDILYALTALQSATEYLP
jgi:hypothetical protein